MNNKAIKNNKSNKITIKFKINKLQNLLNNRNVCNRKNK